MSNGSDMAFPGLSGTFDEVPFRHSGLTKRELFAAMAMQGLLANPSDAYDDDKFPEYAVANADALLAELAKDAK